MALTTGQKKWLTKAKPNILSSWQREQIIAMWENKNTMTAIAKHFGVAVSTVHRVIRDKVKAK